MDEYIKFCEGALVGIEKSGPLMEIFPIRSKETGKRKKERGRRGPLSGAEEYRLFAGEEYKMWDEIEGEEYKIVIERGSKLLGVEAAYLNGVVRRMDKLR